jgi:hypothetical protein
MFWYWTTSRLTETDADSPLPDLRLANATRRPGLLKTRAGRFCSIRWFTLALAGLAGGGAAPASPVTASAPAGTNSAPDRGYVYIHDMVERVPWSINVLKITLNRPDLQLDTVLGGGSAIGPGLLSAMVKTIPAEAGRPVAAINGDFYVRRGILLWDPEGLQIMRGQLVSAPHPDRICFWLDAAGRPHRSNVVAHFQVTWPNGAKTAFGLNEARLSSSAVLYSAALGPVTRTVGGLEYLLAAQTNSPWLPLQVGKSYAARVIAVNDLGNSPLTRNILVLSVGPGLSLRLPRAKVGDVLQLSTATTPDLAGAQTGLGGGPTLVAGGKPWHWPDLVQLRHPRSAIGWNENYFFMVEVDGRQTTSLGMSYAEMADYMIKLGCTEAINLDGGGSAELWVDGAVVNAPCMGKERPSANSLVLLKKTPK